MCRLIQLEWMSNDIGKAFDLQRSNPFELRNVHIMHSLEELDELGNDPKVCAVWYWGCTRHRASEAAIKSDIPDTSYRCTRAATRFLHLLYLEVLGSTVAAVLY